ncbi:MAG: LysE family translocator [Pseudomonadota bacterium]
MAFETWLAFCAATMALLLIPGPTVLLILSYALSQGRRVAVATALGVALGDFIAITASLLGLGALVLASATAFTVLKWVGAIYLIWLGIGLIRTAPSARLGDIGNEGPAPARRVFGHACLVTALNPKGITFFIAFVPQFVDTQAALAPQFAILIATFVGLATGNTLIYALLADAMRDRIGRPAVLTWMTRMGGAALIAMGITTALLRRA